MKWEKFINFYFYFFKRLPPWLQKIWPSALNVFEYFAALSMQGFTSSIELKTMNAGFLLKQILERFKYFTIASLENLEDMIPRRLWLTTGHDCSIINIMNALGVYKEVIHW